MRKTWIFLALLMTVLVACCKMDKHDPTDAVDYTKLKKYVIYDTEKMMTNAGNDCPSRKKGRCVCKAGKDYVSVGNEAIVMMGLYSDNKSLFVAVDDDYKADMYVVEDDWIIWDKEILEDFNLKEPVLIKAGKYEFYKSRNYSRYALLPLSKAELKKRMVVFMEDKEWRAENFYEGYLGECNVLTGIVGMTLLQDKEILSPRSLTLLLPYENNVQEGGDRLMEIVEDGKMIVEEDMFVKGLNVWIMRGIYPVTKVNDGVMVELRIDN